jgi:hypothetical protein
VLVSVQFNGPQPIAPPIAFPNPYQVEHGEILEDAPLGHLAGWPRTFTYSQPEHGTLTVDAANGTFDYEPYAGFVGVDSFTFSVNDGIESNTATIELRVNNWWPVTDDVWATVRHGQSVVIDVPGAIWQDEDPHVTDVVLDTLYGTLTPNPDGTYTYQANQDYVGYDAFVFKVDDDGLTYYSFDTEILLYSDIEQYGVVTIEVTNGPPSAGDDEYTTPIDSMLLVDPLGVLINDSDSDNPPDELTAELVDDVDHGTLILSASGGFQYYPNPGWVGTDTFTYKAFDGQAYSNLATVTIDVTYNVAVEDVSPPDDSGQYEKPLFNPCLCGCECYVGTAADVRANFNSEAANPKPIVMWDATPPASTGFEDTIEAVFNIDGADLPPVFYSMTTLADDPATPGGDPFRMTQQADLSNLPTGRYDYTLTLASSRFFGSTSTYSGSILVVNDSASPIGAGWNISGIRRVYKDATHQGAMVTLGDGTAKWYGDPAIPNDDFAQFSTSETASTLIDRWGKTFYFNAAGMMTSRVERTGQITTYSYIDADGDGDVDDLSSITDPFGRSVTFTYSGGLLASVQHYSGAVTLFAHNGAQLTSITDPDPDGAGQAAAPVTMYAYTGASLGTVTSSGGGVTTTNTIPATGWP